MFQRILSTRSNIPTRTETDGTGDIGSSETAVVKELRVDHRRARSAATEARTLLGELSCATCQRDLYARPPRAKLAFGAIQQPEARHLMLLTRNNAALTLLFDNDILAHDRTTVLFGSDF
eukprot:COSAG04_NODE_20933_length_383_cov_0.753521_1_plen_119_part_10